MSTLVKRKEDLLSLMSIKRDEGRVLSEVTLRGRPIRGGKERHKLRANPSTLRRDEIRVQ